MVDATTFTSSVPVPQVTAAGCIIPSFEAIYAALQADYRSVYGQDVVLDPDTQDGVWVGIQAAAFNDVFAAFLSAYNSFSPTTAQGAGLSSVVKVNGITRDVSTNSQADLTIIGQAGTGIVNGAVSDGVNKWALPASVTIPVSGQIIVTAICQTPGAITASVGTITKLETPTRGWQSVSNAADATAGAPVELDPALRIRQAQSTMLPSLSVLDGIIGAILAIPGVARLRGYENDTQVTDSNGIPGHALALVIDGGDAQAITNVIGLKKGGSGTYGDSLGIYVNPVSGIPLQIRFFRPTDMPIYFGVTLKALTGFTTLIQSNIQQALSDWANALGIGNSLLLNRANVPANLNGSAQSATYEITSLTVGFSPTVLAAADLTIAFNQAALCTPSNIAVTVTT